MPCLSLRAAARAYDRLRVRYFLVEGGRPLPPAAEITWSWAPDPGTWAQTHFDDDGDPHEIALHPVARQDRSLLRTFLLHEMAHMRLGPASFVGGTASCGGRGRRPSRAWLAEVRRLAALGALAEVL